MPDACLFAIGINHRTAPIAVREAVAFSSEALCALLPDLQRRTGAEEIVLVSTCNRTELYLRGACGTVAENAAAWLAECASRDGVDLGPYLYRHDGEEAASHAFRVASGLDSMVLGEPQILGQLKAAVRAAEKAGTLGGSLDRLFQETFAVAKEVRARTAIGELSVSTASACVRLCKQIYGDLDGVRVLFIGAGEMIERAAVHFRAHGPLEMVVANRTFERAQALADDIGGAPMRLADVPAQIHRFDAVVTCTASTLPLIGKGMIETALRLRRHRPMFLVDLAVPRDIEPQVAELADVFMHTLDSLATLTDGNARRRQEQVSRAEVIIAERSKRFGGWLRSRSAVPTIRRLRSSAEHYREIELARARKRLARGDDPLFVIESLAATLTNKLLDAPVRALNRASDEQRPGMIGAFESITRVERAPGDEAADADMIEIMASRRVR